MAYGAGWVTAADRGLLLQLIRGPARVAALDVPGLDPLALALTGKSFVPSAEAEAFLANQLDAVRSQRTVGPKILALVNAYAAGINGYYRAKGIPAAPFTANDVVASAALIAARFGTNGGQEVAERDVPRRARGAVRRGRRAARLRRSARGERRRGAGERARLVPAADARRLRRREASSSTTAASRAHRSRPRRSPRTHFSSARSAPRPGIRSSSPDRRSATSSRSSSPRWSSTGAGFAVRGAVFPGVPLVLVGRGPGLRVERDVVAGGQPRSLRRDAVRRRPPLPLPRPVRADAALLRRHAEGAGAARPGGLVLRDDARPGRRATRRSPASASRSRCSARRAAASCSRRGRSTT